MLIESILEGNLFALAEQALDVYPDPIQFDDFGPYRLLESLGHGGMGEVFLGEDHLAGRRLAIKFMRAPWPEPHLRQRFTQEVKTLAQLEHPFIARLYDAGIHPGGTPYFAMEYVRGKPLDAYCNEHDCNLRERMRLFRCICEAVQYAHSRLFIHRDLKPSNILVLDDGTPKLVDFGIAKHLVPSAEATDQTRTQFAFTPAYESRSLLQHALLVTRRAFGENDRRAAYILNALAIISSKLGPLEEAEAEFNEVIAIYRATFGEFHQFTALAQCNLASTYTRCGKYREAELLLRHALDIYHKVLPPGHINTGIAELKLGRALLGERRYAEAEVHSLAGYDVISRQANPSIEYLRSGRQDLVKIYDGLHEPEKAARFRQEIAALSTAPRH